MSPELQKVLVSVLENFIESLWNELNGDCYICGVEQVKVEKRLDDLSLRLEDFKGNAEVSEGEAVDLLKKFDEVWR